MSEIYVYAANSDDFTTFGLVGALTPTSCVFEEEANGMSEITLEHPIDAWGKYQALEINNLLQVKVPVRTPPAIDDSGNYRNNIFMYRVRSASAKARTLYKNKKRTAKIAVVPAGESVSVFSKPDNGIWEVCSAAYGYGWMSKDGLDDEPYTTYDFDTPSIYDSETAEPAWTVKPQIFRIYEVRKNIASVTVAARHITYDLLYNTTDYKTNSSISPDTAIRSIFQHAIDTNHEFKAFSDIKYTYTGVDWTRINIINAFLDPDIGLCALFRAAFVRDNWNMYVLQNPGMDRGVTIEYARNMTGVEYIESIDEIVTRIMPVGETKDGKPLLLTDDVFGVNYVDSERIGDYPIVYSMVLECENCKVGSDGLTNVTQARNRMREQAEALFAENIDLPKIEMTVDFVTLGDTEDYKQFRDLERMFLYDYVTVRHKQHGVNVRAKIVKIKWDCLLGRMERMDIGSSVKTLANTQSMTSNSQYYVSKGLPSTGGTIDGGLYLKGDPVDPMEAATKQYVDNEISKIEIQGGGSGATFTPHVSTEGVISWTNDGGLLDPEPVNIKGAKGDAGVGIIDITIEEVV